MHSLSLSPRATKYYMYPTRDMYLFVGESSPEHGYRSYSAVEGEVAGRESADLS